MADRSVRPATGQDAPRLAAVQLAAWRAAYGDVLPAGHVESLDPDQVAQVWRSAVLEPPSRRHVVLAALEGATVVGLAALEPAGDDDADETTSELVALAVEPTAVRLGHGSRLLAACAELARQDAVSTVVAWVGPGDEALRALLESAGWEPDGATRTLDLDGGGEVLVPQVRLHAAL